jgi:DNA polymerase-1
MSPKLLIIDGNALIHRAYHAYPSFLSYKGTPTNAVYGFATLLQKAIVNFAPQYVTVCFDTPARTFRKDLYKGYQIKRAAPEENLIGQFQLVRDFLKAAHIYYYEKPGFEADDLIGSITCHIQNKNVNVYVLTGDKDILQLVNDHVFIIMPRKGLDEITIYNTEQVKKRFDIMPNQIPDLKGLMGDASDNYPGVAGIGPKTATQLIHQFKTVENIYKNIEKVENKKTMERLLTYKEDAMMSKKLATILCDMDINFDIEVSKFDSFHMDTKAFFEELQFKSLITKYFPKVSEKEKKRESQKKNPKKTTDQMGLF